MIKLESEKLWQKIKYAAIRAQQKKAAVAYVSDDSWVKFTKGDILITDASDEKISSGSTSPQVLAAALKRGVKLYSCKNLHAKILIFDNTVFIGSANISDHSTNKLKEAGIISTSAQLIKEAEKAIESFRKAAQPIDKIFIKRIKKIDVKPWTTHAQGTGRKNAKPTLLEAFTTYHPLIKDFEIVLLEGEATLKTKQVKEAAKKAHLNLPTDPKKWTFYEFDKSNFPVRIVQKKFKKQGLKIIPVYVKSQNKAIRAVTDMEDHSLIYVDHLPIDGKIAFICFTDSKPPFRTTQASTSQFCKKLSQILKSTPEFGKKLYKHKGWIVSSKEIEQMLKSKN